MITIENSQLTVKIQEKGAELCSIVCKASGTEYLWQAAPDVWAKHSPVLFPIVGTLRNNTYVHKGSAYTMGRHGFARDMHFSVVDQDADQARLELQADATTLQQYPFLFCLQICYTLTDNTLEVAYSVANKGAKTMYFSIGGHPAFRLPINNDLRFEDYNLHFEHKEQADIYPLSPEGHLLAEGVPFLHNTDTIALQKALFYEDALIFKKLKSKKIRLASAKDSRNIEVSFASFPFLGIWSKPDADFVCIEPWQGITDGQHATGSLEDKEGICTLAPQEQWQASWQVKFNS